MLNLKEIAWKRYGAVLSKTTNLHRRKIRKCYEELTDPILASSFLLSVCETKRNHIPNLYGYGEIVEQLLNRSKCIDLKAVTPEQYMDSVDLFENFNHGTARLMWYKNELSWTFPFTAFRPLLSHFTALEFILGFDKHQYPLVGGWDEFVVSLPNFLGLKGVDTAFIEFFQYRDFVRSREFDLWYRASKGYGRNTIERIDWREAFRDEIRRLSDDQLLMRRIDYGWGSDLVRLEMNRRQRGRREI